MKIDVTQVLKNLQGEEMKMVDTEVKDGQSVIKEVPFVFRDAVTNLLNSENNENRLSSEKKNKAWQIIKKLWEKKEVDLTVDDRAFIKERAVIFWGTMAYGVVSELLEEKKP